MQNGAAKKHLVMGGINMIWKWCIKNLLWKCIASSHNYNPFLGVLAWILITSIGNKNKNKTKTEPICKIWIILNKSQEKQQLEEPGQLTPQVLELPGKNENNYI